MFYELKPSETLGNAIEFAGGFQATLTQKMVRVARRSGKEKNFTTSHKPNMTATVSTTVTS